MFKTTQKPDPIAAMRAEVETGRAALAEAEHEMGEAVLDDAPGRRGKAEAAVTVARERQSRLEANLAAVEKAGTAREAQNAARVAQAALAERWATAEANAKIREREGKNLEAAGAAMFAAWRKVELASAEIAGTALAYDPTGAMLALYDLERMLRLGLAKIAREAGVSSFQGLVKGADSYLLDNLAPLSERIEAANVHLRGQRVGP